MADPKEDLELTGWLSTYQWITVGQLLSEYGFDISDTDTLELLSQKSSFYYQLLKIPTMSVLNGIIIEQTQEYQLFLQKLFVDFLVSGQADKPGDELGGETRRSLEQERVKMLAVSEQFEQTWHEHEQIIADSRRAIQSFSTQVTQFLEAAYQSLSRTERELPFTPKDLTLLWIDAKAFTIQPSAWQRLENKIKQKLVASVREQLEQELQKTNELEPVFQALLDTYEPRISGQRVQLNEYRTIFYEWIGQIQGMLYQLPGFKLDEAKDAKNRARLNFDASIGALKKGE